MELSLMPDAQRALDRHEAFWNRAVIDRVPVAVTLPRPGAAPVPTRSYADYQQQWLDIDFRAEQMEAQLSSCLYPYDAFPVAFPNLGPEIFSAWCGCGYRYGATTTWSEPCVLDPDTDTARLDMKHPLFILLMRFTDLLLERGRGKFITSLTDFHPGGDHLAALRDPQQLCIDVLERPEWIRQALIDSEAEYYAAYGAFASKILAAGLPIMGWLPIAHMGACYIPSNDFSCMISPRQFEELFLPGIRRECRFYERSIYHLDGPGALKHLDAILEIPELDAVQWVPTEGTEGFCRWREVYQKIQRAGKGLWIRLPAKEIDDIMSSLRPEGVFIAQLIGLTDPDDIAAAVARLSHWK